MENDGLAILKVYPEILPRVEYSLTKTGESLCPVISVLNDWGTSYIQKSDPDQLNDHFNLSPFQKNQWLKTPDGQ